MSIDVEVREILLAAEPGPLFEQTSYSMSVPHCDKVKGPEQWRVEVYPDGKLISRQVWRKKEQWWLAQQERDTDGVIWPTWPERSQDEIDAAGSPLEGTQQYWTTTGNRLRDSAKWMATVLGAGLAALIGTSPLRDMKGAKLHGGPMIAGMVGLALIGVTLLLVLLVMCPKSVSLDQVQQARRRRFLPGFLQSPLYEWQQAVESEQDLYLPCGITDLNSLRDSMSIEECTLMALSRAGATARDKKARKDLHKAQTARAARLLELRTAAARVAMIGEYHNLKRRSTRATYGGVIVGVAATMCIVAAFVLK